MHVTAPCLKIVLPSLIVFLGTSSIMFIAFLWIVTKSLAFTNIRYSGYPSKKPSFSLVDKNNLFVLRADIP